MRPAHQRVHRPHPEDADKTAIVECADKLVAAVTLAPHPAKELLHVEVRTQLRDERENPLPFARLEAADLQLTHRLRPARYGMNASV